MTGLFRINDANGNDVTVAKGLGDVTSEELGVLEHAARFRSGARPGSIDYANGTEPMMGTVAEIVDALTRLRYLRGLGLPVNPRELFGPHQAPFT